MNHMTQLEQLRFSYTTKGTLNLDLLLGILETMESVAKIQERQLKAALEIVLAVEGRLKKLELALHYQNPESH